MKEFVYCPGNLVTLFVYISVKMNLPVDGAIQPVFDLASVQILSRSCILCGCFDLVKVRLNSSLLITWCTLCVFHLI